MNQISVTTKKNTLSAPLAQIIYNKLLTIVDLALHKSYIINLNISSRTDFKQKRELSRPTS